jgi:hypothetical protein
VTRLSTFLLISLLLFNLLVAAPPQLNAQAPVSKLHIDIVEGDGQIINVKSHINPAPVVQVVDDNNQPIPGALVVFFLPSQGPGGTFANGSRNLTVSTDRSGRAAAAGVIPTRQTGQYEIRATASYQGQTASADIAQTNVSGISASNTGGGLSAKAWIIIGIAAGAVVGGVFAARSSGSSSATTSNSGIVINAGTPTVGPRQ